MTPSKRKVKGQARQTAMQLFGVPGKNCKMETPEQRAEVAEILAFSPDPKIRELVRQCRMPELRQTSFASLAESLGLNFYMIADEIKLIQRSEGFIRMARHLPEIMEQTAVDAKSQWCDCSVCGGIGKVDVSVLCEPCGGKKGNTECEQCHGKGKYGEIQDCLSCKGKGLVYIMGDAERLKLVFETFGLSGKGGGVNVNLDLRKPPESHEGLHDLAQSLGPILEGERK